MCVCLRSLRSVSHQRRSVTRRVGAQPEWIGRPHQAGLWRLGGRPGPTARATCMPRPPAARPVIFPLLDPFAEPTHARQPALGAARGGARADAAPWWDVSRWACAADNATTRVESTAATCWRAAGAGHWRLERRHRSRPSPLRNHQVACVLVGRRVVPRVRVTLFMDFEVFTCMTTSQQHFVERIALVARRRAEANQA